MIYRTICTQLWTDRKIQRLTVQGKLLFVYLITNPHTHLSGIYYLPNALITKETGLSDTLLHTLFASFADPTVNLAHYDEETSTVFVVNMFGYQGKGEKNERSAAHHLRALHHTPLINVFLERYPSVRQFCPDTLLDTVSTLSKRCPSVPDPVPSSEGTSSLNSLSSPDPNPKVCKDGAVQKSDAPKNGVDTWASYSEAYLARYHVTPVRNQQVNSQLKQLVGKLGHDKAPLIAAFYLTHNKPLYVSARHPTNLLLRDATGLHTEWATGVKATTGESKNLEARDDAREQVKRVEAILKGGLS